MKKYGLVDKNNKIVNTIVLKDGDEWEPPEGCTLLDSDKASIGMSVVDGVLVIPEPEPVLESTYQEKRRAEYPVTGDQLDVIWKEFENMRNQDVNLLEETEKMLTKIKNVKKKHVKK